MGNATGSRATNSEVSTEQLSDVATTIGIFEELSQPTESHLREIKKSLKDCTRAKTKSKVTTSYPMLHEPTIQVSPQMRKIKHFNGGGYCKVKCDEFKMANQFATIGEPITYEEILKAIIDGNWKRIALIGGAGAGRTAELNKLAQKLLYTEGHDDNESNLKQFHIFHTVNLKDMPPKASTTLQDCLFGRDIPDGDDRMLLLKYIIENQSKTIILLDDLNQACFDTKLARKKISNWEKTSTEILIYNLMSGNILPNVKVVISSRGLAILTLPEEARPEYAVALAGFKKEDAKNLFLDLVHDADLSWENIEENLGDLVPMLAIPAYLVVAADAYKRSKEKNEHLPTFVSGLLAKIITAHPKNKYMQVNLMDYLEKLKKLAYHAIKDKQKSFDDAYLEKQGLTAKDVSYVMSKVPSENIAFHSLLMNSNSYFFCHRSIEEFLAACYINETNLTDFTSFTQHEFRKEFRHWSKVIQYLSGITLNDEIEPHQNPLEVSDKKRKQEVLRKALLQSRESQDASAYYIALHESNDNELIRQLQEIYIRRTPMTATLAQAISSLMRRSKSIRRIWIMQCGITDEVLRIMATNMEGSRVSVKKLWLVEEKWNVTCSTLNYFIACFTVEELEMEAFPTDYHEAFPNFESVKTLKMRGYDVIITHDRDQVLFECSEMSGNFDKKEKLLKLHFKNEYHNDKLVTALKKLCSTERVHVAEK